MTLDAKREAVSYLQATYDVGERRPSVAMALNRSMIRYESKRPDDTERRDQMKQIASERQRFGIHMFFEREGIQMTMKPLRLIYTKEKLQVKRSGGQKHALGTRRPWKFLPQ